MEKFLYYLGCFVAIGLLSGLPRFLFEIHAPFFFAERMLVLALFLSVAWFFRTALHEKWNTSVLSSLFFIEAVASVCFALLLFLQLFSPFFAYVAGILLIAKFAVYSYIAIDKLKHLRGLVYTTVFSLLLVGELIIVFGL